MYRFTNHINMAFEILRDDELEELLRKVFRKNPVIRSQASLSRALAQELDGRLQKVSGKRLRRFTMDRELARLEIIYRRSPASTSDCNCPVCAATMEDVKNSTLEGGTAIIAQNCPSCAFKVGINPQEPARYVFHARKG